MAKKKTTEEVIKKEAAPKAAAKKTSSKKFDHEDLKTRLIDKLAGIRNVSLEDVGKAGLYLASDLSSGTSGQILYVDCGCHSVYASIEEMDDICKGMEA